LFWDAMGQKVVRTLSMPQSPSGLAVSADNTRLYVTCAGPASTVCVVEVVRHKIIGTFPAGHTAQAPVLSPDGKTLYVCNQFDNDVSVIDLSAGRHPASMRIAVPREPVAADVTPDGKYLLVANQLHSGRADGEEVAAVVSVIDTAAGRVVRELPLPSGSEVLKGLRVSPDGKFAAVTHLFASFGRATTQVKLGWMNANALSLIDLRAMKVRSTLLLDEPLSGAANPWGLAWSADGRTLAVAHAGTHEVSLIDFPALLVALPPVSTPVSGGARSVGPGVLEYSYRLGRVSVTPSDPRPGAYPRSGTVANGPKVLTQISHYEGLDPGLPFLTGARVRVRLAVGDVGPRAVLMAGDTVYTADYFSDSLSAMDLKAVKPVAASFPLGPRREWDAVRRGEFYFNDATLCEQGWQSCASCHPGDARVDGLNWDLLNDGIGNPKNTRSLLLAHRTPPAMFLGVRTNAETAVRADLQFILFTNPPESVAVAMDEYLKSLRPVPSPHLVRGGLSRAAKRGEKLFVRAGCADCHGPGLYTDLQTHEVGTRVGFDRPTDRFYTPTLIEVWRTAPYLHDGSAATLWDVLTTRNAGGQHGDVSGLSSQQLDDLCEYVLSL
jgi:DNA-binding beta-propeller fold protein YncE